MNPRIEAGDDVSAIVAKFGAELRDPAEPFTLLCRFKVNDGTDEKVKTAFAAARAATLKEEGAMAFDLNQGTRDPTQFTVYERWRSLADLESHLRTSYIIALRGQFNALIVGAPEFQVLRPAAE
ncbi:MAG TPA: antibiotic biosynthesis monooxygenase [Dongiaceae bacterium]|jgi:quinol monooxygenase YgiN